MSYEESFATLEKLLLCNVNMNGDADMIKILLLKPQVILENPYYYLEVALGAAAQMYKDGDYETAIEILIGMFELDGIEEGETAVPPTHYCHTVTLMEILTVLSLLKMEATRLAFDYIEAAVQNIDTYLNEEKLYASLVDSLLELGHSLISI